MRQRLAPRVGDTYLHGMTVITRLQPESVDFAAFDNSYARLPERFYARLPPTPVAEPHLVKLNLPLARQLGLDPERLASPDGVAVLAGNRVPRGADPIALAYAGHQFGNFVPQLGDGRAILLGEVVDPAGGRHDLQLKGSGPTPFSRRGDGRAVLGPVLREYIISEAMAAFGIPTTRSLAAVLTGEKIWRETEELGAVLTRTARSHVRIGTFEFFAARRDVEALRTLADYVIARLYPEIVTAAKPGLALLETVMARLAALVARWQGVGFIHGVMNTDNMSIAGETIDYGPCAFMDTFHPATVYSSIDQAGRYAWGNQPYIAHWNLVQFAQALLPLLGDDQDAAIAEAQKAIDAFPSMFEAAWTAELRRKLGLVAAEADDLALAQDLLKRMEDNGADFTLTFRYLADAALGPGHDAPVRALFVEPAQFDAWAVRWRTRLDRESLSPGQRRENMRAVNPLFTPRNHRVEFALMAANEGDLSKLDELLAALASPFEDQPERAHLANPPGPDEIVRRTFCGT